MQSTPRDLALQFGGGVGAFAVLFWVLGLRFRVSLGIASALTLAAFAGHEWHHRDRAYS